MTETWDEMIEREGGYYLNGFTSGYEPCDVDYVPYCLHCGAQLLDMSDNAYEHKDDGRECWERRQARAKP